LKLININPRQYTFTITTNQIINTNGLEIAQKLPYQSRILKEVLITNLLSNI
jgi:hypothetical protein